MFDARTSSLRSEIQSLDKDIEALLMERIKDKANAERYTALITRLTADQEKARLELISLETHDAKLRRKRRELTKRISSLDEVLKNTLIDEADLRRLTECIELKQNGKTVEVKVKLINLATQCT